MRGGSRTAGASDTISLARVDTEVNDDVRFSHRTAQHEVHRLRASDIHSRPRDSDTTKRSAKATGGPHHCVGAAIARLQTHIVLEEMLNSCPRFEVDAAAGRFAPGAYVRRYEALPIRTQGGSAGVG